MKAALLVACLAIGCGAPEAKQNLSDVSEHECEQRRQADSYNSEERTLAGSCHVCTNDPNCPTTCSAEGDADCIITGFWEFDEDALTVRFVDAHPINNDCALVPAYGLKVCE